MPRGYNDSLLTKSRFETAFFSELKFEWTNLSFQKWSKRQEAVKKTGYH